MLEGTGIDPRYETFGVELILTNGSALSTRVMHVSSGDEQVWNGWDRDRFALFFVERAGIQEGMDNPLRARLRQVRVGAGSGPVRMIRSSDPFEVQMLLDVTSPSGGIVEPVEYVATVRARPLGSDLPVTVGKARGSTPPGETHHFLLGGLRLKEGLYRLDAGVTLKPSNSRSGEVTANLEGGLLHVV